MAKYVAAVLAVVLALAGGTLTRAGLRDPAVVPPAPPPVAAGPGPARLDIASIGVHTRLIRLGPRPDTTMPDPPPGRDAPAGWYEQPPRPGADRTTVLAGHVDGPGVFHRLGELRPGDPIVVRRTDGRRTVYVVTSVRLRPAPGVPSGEPGLVLITRGGDFDHGRRKFRSELVVSARVPTSVEADQGRI